MHPGLLPLKWAYHISNKFVVKGFEVLKVQSATHPAPLAVLETQSFRVRHSRHCCGNCFDELAILKKSLLMPVELFVLVVSCS